MAYILMKNGKTVKHIIVLGNPKKSWNRDQSIVDLSFETMEAANEVANVLEAKVQKAA